MYILNKYYIRQLQLSLRLTIIIKIKNLVPVLLPTISSVHFTFYIMSPK
jgi:hypothetical protein